MATVFIPPMMQKLTNGVGQVEIEGKTLRQIVEGLEVVFPGTKKWLVEDDHLRPGVAAAVDGETVSMGLISAVEPNSEVHFIPALGGGA
ncbi:MAG: MoaD/ThiS family protein [Candidatus Poribacteria bacterium]|nr:MoaD/ThiS family protein [Candidatus Poribacteria bacterium]